METKNNQKVNRPLLHENIELTKTEKRILDFINSFSGDSFNYSQMELAKLTNSSNAAISRFIRKYKHQDYRNFIASLNSQLSEFSKKYPIDWAENDEYRNYNLIATSHRYAIDNTYDLELLDHINNAAKLINASRNIYIHGSGSSQRTSLNLVSNCLKIGRSVISSSDFHIFFPSLASITPNDVLIIFSNNLKTSEATFVIRKAYERKAKIIVITSNSDDKINELVDIRLLYHKIHNEAILVPSSSKIAQILIADLLFEAILKDDPKSYDILKRARKMIQEWADIDGAHGESDF